MRILARIVVIASIVSCAMFGAVTAARTELFQSDTARGYYKAAIQGQADAQEKLAELYASGIDVGRSDAAALQWFMRAAAQGHTKAQLMLAKIWASGQGVPRTNSLAYRWAYIASTGAVDDGTRGEARVLLGELEKSLPAEEISDLQQRAAAWKPKLEESRSIDSPTETAAMPVNKEPRSKVRKTSYYYKTYSRTRAVSRTLRARLWHYARLLGF